MKMKAKQEFSTPNALRTKKDFSQLLIMQQGRFTLQTLPSYLDLREEFENFVHVDSLVWIHLKHSFSNV